MDYILEQVKEKGIVKYIESYVEDLERVEHYKKCMKKIENIDYKICNQKEINKRTFSFKIIKGIGIVYISTIYYLYVAKYKGNMVIKESVYAPLTIWESRYDYRLIKQSVYDDGRIIRESVYGVIGD